MEIVLALASAVVFGAADFAGGIGARRHGESFVVVYTSQLIGLAAAVAIAPWFSAPQVTLRDLAWGASAGFVGAAGLLLFYRALAIGTMSIVSPITAVVSAAVPVAVGVASGERPTVAASTGIGLGLCALAMFGGGGDPAQAHHGRIRAIGPAVLAGVGFGAFFALISHSGEDSALWPLVAARVGSVTLLTALAISNRTQPRVPKALVPIVVSAGAGDMIANALFLVASRRGDLAIVGVLAALYPASTLLLARYVLHERLQRMHQVAIGATLVAVALIASG